MRKYAFTHAVLSWRAEDDLVILQTEHGEIETERLVVATGAWAGSLLAELNVPLTIRRKAQVWFGTEDLAPYRPGNLPSFCFETSEGVYYGFPGDECIGDQSRTA